MSQNQGMNLLQYCAFFTEQLIRTYAMVGIETARGIQVRKIIDTHLSSDFVKSTSPEVVSKEINDAIFAYYKKKQVESLK